MFNRRFRLRRVPRTGEGDINSSGDGGFLDVDYVCTMPITLKSHRPSRAFAIMTAGFSIQGGN
jgi:hypothetical protein